MGGLNLFKGIWMELTLPHEKLSPCRAGSEFAWTGTGRDAFSWLFCSPNLSCCYVNGAKALFHIQAISGKLALIIGLWCSHRTSAERPELANHCVDIRGEDWYRVTSHRYIPSMLSPRTWYPWVRRKGSQRSKASWNSTNCQSNGGTGRCRKK